MLRCAVLRAVHDLGGKTLPEIRPATISIETAAIMKEEIIMISKTKTALVAALVIGSASVALADDLPYTAEKAAYLHNPNAPVPTYNEAAPAYEQPAYQIAYAPQVRGQLIEGRNVGVSFEQTVPAEQKHWYERAPIDFNT
jgi:hypothetical protein